MVVKKPPGLRPSLVARWAAAKNWRRSIAASLTSPHRIAWWNNSAVREGSIRSAGTTRDSRGLLFVPPPSSRTPGPCRRFWFLISFGSSLSESGGGKPVLIGAEGGGKPVLRHFELMVPSPQLKFTATVCPYLWRCQWRDGLSFNHFNSRSLALARFTFRRSTSNVLPIQVADTEPSAVTARPRRYTQRKRCPRTVATRIGRVTDANQRSVRRGTGTRRR